MKHFTRRVSTLALSALLFSQGMMADSFVGGRTDGTIRKAKSPPKTHAGAETSRDSSTSLTTSRLWASPLSGSTPSCRMLRDMTIMATTPRTSLR